MGNQFLDIANQVFLPGVFFLKRALMEEAEKIAKKKGFKTIRVISGVGVREYYKKLSYNIDKEKIYMEKTL